ncbi:MAG: universal stress protein [Deltaproteobacteria bacterium]|nr:universal stress protein [Deltaproteobacteria bacterium]
MEKISKILAPTDFSELSQAGVRYALELAKAVKAEVTVYHVVSQGELIQYYDKLPVRPFMHPVDTYQKAMSRFMKTHFADLTADVKVHEKVEMGVAEKNIVNLAEEEGMDLIVISTHGRTGMSHMLVGSVTEKVVRLARCPVLSIPSHTKEEAKGKLAAAAS